MRFLDLARERFSVVDYSLQPVEKEKIDRIMDAALAAPTACNRQPQRILIIDDEEKRQRLHNVIPGKFVSPLAFLICYDRDACWIRPMDGKSSGDIDASIVTTHMMMEMTDLGLGSIWVMNWDPAKMRKEFELADNLEPVALLVAGYKGENASPRRGHLETKSREEILFTI